MKYVGYEKESFLLCIADFGRIGPLRTFRGADFAGKGHEIAPSRSCRKNRSGALKGGDQRDFEEKPAIRHHWFMPCGRKFDLPDFVFSTKRANVVAFRSDLPFGPLRDYVLCNCVSDIRCRV